MSQLSMKRKCLCNIGQDTISKDHLFSIVYLSLETIVMVFIFKKENFEN